VLVAHLNILISDSSQHLEIDTSLSDQEMRIAVMIKNGLTSQKIANMLVTFKSVGTDMIQL
jgi:DNA-binding NarL/FixJ family response regulator